MAGKVQELTDSNFEATTKSGVTLVDFWAPWCPPCRMQGPIIEKVAEAYADGKAAIGKVNVDENPEVATKYGVSSIPTLIILKDGEEKKRMVGLQQEPSLIAAVNAAL